MNGASPVWPRVLLSRCHRTETCALGFLRRRRKNPGRCEMFQCHREMYCGQAKMFSFSESLECQPGTLWALTRCSDAQLCPFLAGQGIPLKTYLGSTQRVPGTEGKASICPRPGTQSLFRLLRPGAVWTNPAVFLSCPLKEGS